MHARRAAFVGAIGIGLLTGMVGCSGAGFPDVPAEVGEGFPGTCLPSELSWPTDFLESLPGEKPGVGTVVGLRLVYADDAWMWRVRSPDSREDLFGERVEDPGYGSEVLLDSRTLEVRATREIELTEAEQAAPGWVLDAALRSGETWPSPLIVDITRVAAGWQVTTCDTATNELTTNVLG